MKHLSHTLEKEMYWVQPDIWDTQYELHAKDGIHETFDYQRGFLKSSVNVHSAFGEWQLKQGGFFNPDIVIFDSKTNSKIATYSRNFWSGGWAEFSSSGKFLWKPLDFFHTEWGFENEQKHVLFSLRYGAKESRFSNLFKTQAVIELKKHGYRYNTGELSLLLALGWWLLIIESENSAATAGMTGMMAASS